MTSSIRALKVLASCVILCSLSVDAIAAEPAWWAQMKKDCTNSGGQLSSEYYNEWKGCIGGSSGGGSAGGYTPQQQMMLNAAQQMMPVLQQAIHDAIYGNPQEQARQAAEAVRIQELQRAAQEEDARKAEAASRRILAMLKGTEPSGSLTLKLDGSGPSISSAGALASNLALVKLGDSEQPLSGAGAPASNLALLKLSDAETAANASDSAQKGQGFDTAGGLAGSVVLPPPPTPGSVAVPTKEQTMRRLQGRLEQNIRDQKFLAELLATLRRSPGGDPKVFDEIQDSIKANAAERDRIASDLTATEQQTVSEPEKQTVDSGSGGVIGWDEGSQSSQAQ